MVVASRGRRSASVVLERRWTRSLQYGAPAGPVRRAGLGAPSGSPTWRSPTAASRWQHAAHRARCPGRPCEAVDGRYGLRLRHGVRPRDRLGRQPPRPAASAPRARQSAAAAAVTERLEALRAAGHLDDRRLERPAPRTTWHVPLIAAVAVLVVATVVLPLLA